MRRSGQGPKKVVITVFTQAVIFSFCLFITGFYLAKKFMGPEEFGYWQILSILSRLFKFIWLGPQRWNRPVLLADMSMRGCRFQRIRASMRVFFILSDHCYSSTFLLPFLFARDPTRQEIYQVLALSVPSICLQCMCSPYFYL